MFMLRHIHMLRTVGGLRLLQRYAPIHMLRLLMMLTIVAAAAIRCYVTRALR